MVALGGRLVGLVGGGGGRGGGKRSKTRMGRDNGTVNLCVLASAHHPMSSTTTFGCTVRSCWPFVAPATQKLATLICLYILVPKPSLTSEHMRAQALSQLHHNSPNLFALLPPFDQIGCQSTLS